VGVVVRVPVVVMPVVAVEEPGTQEVHR
jgi:hypothetical protein